MALSYGFYDSVNGDKTYSASDFSKIFDGIIGDGIIAGYGNALGVRAAETSMKVCIGAGRAWFNHTWTHNDADIYIGISNKPTSGYKRIDTVVVEVNLTNRTNTIKVVTGTQVPSSSTPSSPGLIQGANGVYQYPLADIHLNGSMTAITGDCVRDRRNFAPILSVNVNDVFKQYDSSFNAWFGNLKGTLDDDVAYNLSENFQNLQDSVDVPYQHRNIFRGKNLGTSITNAQLTAIRNATFNDIYVGDYWVLGGVKWRVVDIDYWYRGCGSNTSVAHHVLVMPDEPVFGDVKANLIATTSGGFANSNMATDYGVFSLAQAEYESFFDYWRLPADLRNCTESIYEYLVDRVDNNGRPTHGDWYVTTYSVPSEIMIYGTRIWSYGNTGNTGIVSDDPDDTGDHLFTNSTTQLALFRLCPQYIFSKSRYWLRDTVSATQFAIVLECTSTNSAKATANRAVASSAKSVGIRPIFAIG